MLNGGEYLFSGCKKQIDFLIYMQGKKTTEVLLFFFKKERQSLLFMHHLQSTLPAEATFSLCELSGDSDLLCKTYARLTQCSKPVKKRKKPRFF